MSGSSLRRALCGGLAPALLCAASAAQELPRGGGPVPALRRGADGQIEVAPTNPPSPAAPARPRHSGRGPAPAVEPSVKAPEVRSAGVTRTPLSEIVVAPVIPRISDTTPRGAVVASFSVRRSDGAPFTGTVRFGAPYYDSQQVFALSGNRIIVNPDGPGIRSDKATVTHRITLETVP